MRFLLVALFFITLCAAARNFPSLGKYGKVKALKKERDTKFCTLYACAKTSETCTGNSTVDFYCEGATYCNDDTKVCTAYSELGTTCSLSTDNCEGSCINGVCNSRYLPGAKCSDNNQCYYEKDDGTDVVLCDKKRCAGLLEGEKCPYDDSCYPPLTCGPAGTCIKPQKLGALCSSDNDCKQPYVCSNLTCVETIPEGAACDTRFNYRCAAGSLCTPTARLTFEGKCIKAFSQPGGSYCTSDSMCGEKLYCDYTSTGGVCATGATKSSLKPCNYSDDSVCETGEECRCTYNKGQNECRLNNYANPSGIKKAYEDLIKCSLKCDRSDTPCLASKCKGKICAYNKFDNIEEAEIYPKCAVTVSNSDFDGYFTCGGVELRSSIVVVAILSVLAMIAL